VEVQSRNTCNGLLPIGRQKATTTEAVVFNGLRFTAWLLPSLTEEEKLLGTKSFIQTGHDRRRRLQGGYSSNYKVLSMFGWKIYWDMNLCYLVFINSVDSIDFTDENNYKPAQPTRRQRKGRDAARTLLLGA
jgi:hypothetical protein